MSWRWLDAPKPTSLRSWQAVALHARLQFVRMASLRQLWPWLVLVLFVAVASVLRVRASQPDTLTDILRSGPMAALGLVALGLGATAIRGDADTGALELFYLRPRGPLALPVGRWLAVALWSSTAGWLMVGATLVVTTGTGLAPSLAEAVRHLWAVALAALAYAAVFVALACWFQRAAVTGLAWYVVGDTLLPRFVTMCAWLSPGYHAGLLIDGHYPPASSPLRDLLGVAAQHVAVADPWDGRLLAVESVALVLLTGLAVAAAVWRLHKSIR